MRPALIGRLTVTLPAWRARLLLTVWVMPGSGPMMPRPLRLRVIDRTPAGNRRSLAWKPPLPTCSDLAMERFCWRLPCSCCRSLVVACRRRPWADAGRSHADGAVVRHWAAVLVLLAMAELAHRTSVDVVVTGPGGFAIGGVVPKLRLARRGWRCLSG